MLKRSNNNSWKKDEQITRLFQEVARKLCDGGETEFRSSVFLRRGVSKNAIYHRLIRTYEVSHRVEMVNSTQIRRVYEVADLVEKMKQKGDWGSECSLP